MLKNGRAFGKDYFDELLEKIREIRASERRAYQKIADVFEQCSSDYRGNSEETQLFYQAVQNRLHFASAGKTAAEIVFERADSTMPHMGLTTWKNSPRGKVLKSDVSIAKNYLNEMEVSKLNRLVTMFIDFAELRALNRQVMKMSDWLVQVEKFLNFTDQQILRNAGKISHEMALAKAHEEYEKFRVKQDRDYLSDFDQAFARYLKGDTGMKLHFEPNLDYQHTAIESVCDLFRGQEICRTEFTVTRDATAVQQTMTFAQSNLGIGNRLHALHSALLRHPCR